MSLTAILTAGDGGGFYTQLAMPSFARNLHYVRSTSNRVLESEILRQFSCEIPLSHKVPTEDEIDPRARERRDEDAQSRARERIGACNKWASSRKQIARNRQHLRKAEY
jgi:hypothetical protein